MVENVCSGLSPKAEHWLSATGNQKNVYAEKVTLLAQEGKLSALGFHGFSAESCTMLCRVLADMLWGRRWIPPNSACFEVFPEGLGYSLASGLAGSEMLYALEVTGTCRRWSVWVGVCRERLPLWKLFQVQWWKHVSRLPGSAFDIKCWHSVHLFCWWQVGVNIAWELKVMRAPLISKPADKAQMQHPNKASLHYERSITGPSCLANERMQSLMIKPSS